MRRSETDGVPWLPSRRALGVALVLAAVYLVASAAPVAAMNVAVVSSNSTATELGNGTLTNAEVERSGEAGFVGYGLYNSSAVGRWAFDYGSGSTAYDYVGSNDGTINGATWTSGMSGNALSFDGNDDQVSVTIPRAPSALTVSMWAKFDDPAAASNPMTMRGNNGFMFQPESGDLGAELWNGSSWKRVSAPHSTGVWTHWAATWDGSTLRLYKNGVMVNSTAAGINTDMGQNDIFGRSQGASFWSGDLDDVRVYDDALTDTQIQRLHDAPNAKLSDMSGTWWQQNGSYEASHAAENSVRGRTDLTLRNASATVTFETGGGAVLNSTTYTTSGNRTLSWPESSATSVVLNVTFNPTDADHTARLHYESVSANNRDPIVNDSTASPNSASETIDSSTITLSVNVSDPDFPTAQGDTDEVNFYVDDSLEGTDTLTSIGTASLVINDVTGGEHTWHVEVDDAYGGSARGPATGNYSFAAPANITIRNESEPHDIIKSATVDVLVSGSEETVDRQQVTDGNISLVGVPTNEEYIVVVDTEDYHQRSIYVPSVYDQSAVFLLNDSLESRRNEFQVEDRTGLFGEPILEIQRAINKSKYDPDAEPKYQWLTIAGDRLGASESYTTNLEYGARYRLVIRQGVNTRVLGEHTVEANETVPLPIGQIEWSMPQDAQYNWTFHRVDHPTSGSGEALRFGLNDTTDSTSDIEGVIHEVGNDSNVLTTFSSSSTAGTFVYTEPLSTAEADVDWQLEWNATRSGEDVGSTGVDDLRRLGGSVPLFSAFQSLDPDWRQGITLMAILGAGFVYSGLFASVGALFIVGVAVVLWVVGLSTVGLGLSALTLVISIGYRLAERGGR